MENDTVLEIKNVSVDYEADNGTVHAVTNVSLSLPRGEILGLAGESGSGKSTLAYAITRLLRPPALITGGSVLYYPRNAGQKHKDAQQDEEARQPIDILRLSDAQLTALRWNDLAIVFQSAMNALHPILPIGEQIIDVLRTHRPSMSAESRKQRAEELLRLVGISSDRLRSYPHELSGGMRQRAIIAIALALNPEIVILDEPTTALDVVVQREILSELLRLREQFGFSVIFITHDLSLLLEVADRIAIMYAGRLIETASRQDMYSHPRHPYSYGLLNSFPTLDGPRRVMYGIPGSPPDLRAIPTGCPFHPRCPLAFEVCPRIIPPLQALPAETPDTSPSEQAESRVACHLYDTRYHTPAPQSAEIAAAYANLAEKKESRAV